MESRSNSSVSSGKRRILSGSKVARSGLIPSSNRAASFQKWKATAPRCRTRRQFREFLDRLQAFLPFQNLVCVWGYQSRETIGFIFNHSFPRELLRWFLTKGLLWRGPMFREWRRTNTPQVSTDVMRRLPKQFDPELLEQANRFHLTGVLAGGVQTKDVWVYVAMCMGSEQKCRAHLQQFELVVPVLAQALQRACPRPLLTKRETAILQRRTMGEITKQIAAAEGISGRTVREHLQSIKRKLYTDDLVNAVVIAMRSGMLLHTWKK
jgi:DNA-binding CsgD family transcriptional regulator